MERRRGHEKRRISKNMVKVLFAEVGNKGKGRNDNEERTKK